MAGVRWFKLDASYPTNPKIHRLSHAAFRLHIAMMSYAAEHITDGEISAGSLPVVCRNAHLSPRSWPRVIGKLADAGLIEPTADGWMLHDWLVMNPQVTRAAIDAERVRARERQRRHRADVTP